MLLILVEFRSYW